MKKAVFVILLCVIILSGCGSNQNMSSQSDEPSIPVVNNTFDVTVDECINILNESLEEEELSLISTEYIIVKGENETVYKSTINNRLMIRFVITEDESDGIMLIGLSYLKNAEYDSSNKNQVFTDSAKKEIEAKRYYQIICNNIKPRINVKKFIGNVRDYDSVTYGEDDRIFTYGLRSFDGIGGRENVYVYEVISSEKLYNKYIEKINEDANVFFINL